MATNASTASSSSGVKVLACPIEISRPNKKHAVSVWSYSVLDNRNSGANFFNEINADKHNCDFLK
jgi:hypothetical protein